MNQIGYVDFGPSHVHPRGHGTLISGRYADRPFCDLCGSFRGRHLRKIDEDEFGTLWRCQGCDEEAIQ